MMRCAPEYRKYVDNIDRKILIPSRQTKVLCERHPRNGNDSFSRTNAAHSFFNMIVQLRLMRFNSTLSAFHLMTHKSTQVATSIALSFLIFRE